MGENGREWERMGERESATSISLDPVASLVWSVVREISRSFSSPLPPTNMSDDKLTRVAIINADKCKPKKCKQECKRSCPVVRMGTSPLLWLLPHFSSNSGLLSCHVELLTSDFDCLD